MDYNIPQLSTQGGQHSTLFGFSYTTIGIILLIIIVIVVIVYLLARNKKQPQQMYQGPPPPDVSPGYMEYPMYPSPPRYSGAHVRQAAPEKKQPEHTETNEQDNSSSNGSGQDDSADQSTQ